VRGQAGPSLKTQNHDDLVALRELVEAGKVTPVIDGTYSLADTADAIRRVASGHARGTIVIDVLGSSPAAVSTQTAAWMPAAAVPA